MTFINASTWPLLWWWEDYVMASSMFFCLQTCLNASDVKFVPASKMCGCWAGLFFYSRKLALVSYKAWKCFTFNKRYQHQPPAKSFMVLHTGLSSYMVVSADIPRMWHTVLVFLMSAFIFTKYTDSLTKVQSFQCLGGCCATAPVFVSAIEKVLFFCSAW